ncbi:hypothetical protein [Hungatella hathewayi]|uniref:hypothetical protein n=1 Tax=Hungatella hathewayi TaxID=154046 RepID=UPI003566E16D
MRQIIEFIEKELDYHAIDNEINAGIYETNPIARNKNGNQLTIGCSFETDDDGLPIYIYNVFNGDEYINICGYSKKK